TGASGWTDTGLGDFNVSHKFPGPEKPIQDVNRAAIIGLFGGLTLAPPLEHRWSDEVWWHQYISDPVGLVRRYEQMHEELRRFRGLAGAFYHQLTDIESECNGLMSYDRQQLKISAEDMERINKQTINSGNDRGNTR
ncbi:MAG: hypothetical protein FWE95_09345, partial [Planctomycetaceae bacterium]|nr:hypothetical protein [Planctomycetaceae bacterium]